MDALTNLLPDEASAFWKVGRLKTFKQWPFQSESHGCNPEKMASAGFIAIGNEEEPDLAECFLCRKQLDGWEPEDDPWQEHIKHQADCPFVKLNKRDEALWTVQELFEMFKKYLVKERTRELELAIEKAKQEAAALCAEIPLIYRGVRRSLEG